jgi:hypothetical protein
MNRCGGRAARPHTERGRDPFCWRLRDQIKAGHPIMGLEPFTRNLSGRSGRFEFRRAKGKTLKSALFGSASINYLVKYAAMRRDHPKS